MKRPRLFTAHEAAALLGMKYGTFDNWVRRHHSPCIRVGHQRRFTVAQIDAIKQARKERL